MRCMLMAGISWRTFERSASMAQIRCAVRAAARSSAWLPKESRCDRCCASLLIYMASVANDAALFDGVLKGNMKRVQAALAAGANVWEHLWPRWKSSGSRDVLGLKIAIQPHEKWMINIFWISIVLVVGL